MSVAVPIPSLDLLTYRLPETLPAARIGVRVLVPLGARIVTGCVVDGDCDGDGEPAGQGSGLDTLRDVVDVLDEEAFIPEDVVGLARWVAEYYLAGPGEAIAAAMPPGAWMESERRAQITGAGRERLAAGGATGARLEVLRALAHGRAEPIARLAGRLGRLSVAAAIGQLARDGLVTVSQPLRGAASRFRTVKVVHITAEGLDLAGSAEGEGRSPGPRQVEALRALSGQPDGLPLRELAGRGIGGDTIARLARRGLVSIERRRRERDPFATGMAASSDERGAGDTLALSDEQAAALDRLILLAAERAFRAVLLHGVTGSGKTEVYLRLARAVCDDGRGALVLVPEIALTPAVAARFRQAFGSRVAIQHSGLSEGERYDQWHRIRAGEVDVVVGTRSAVFAPLERIGLIVVDEEHDASYKQEDSPRYHGRDVAVMRAKRAGALVVLGSATPALESYQNALAGRYERLVLERRILDRPLASVCVVNMRETFAREGPDVVLSGPLREALGARLARREQALVLLNRRGYAAAVFCRECAGTLECPNCSVALTVHRAARRARCHYCNYSMALPRTCASCGGGFLEQIGFGTERVEGEIRACFPAARVARVDRDTIRRRGALVSLLDRFGRGDLDVLVGTQMIAKGHDFPAVTLVGVISADVGLGLADFRAAERTFQLLTQVVGRAGRGRRHGEAFVQTLYPDHYSIGHARRQDYVAFFEAELAFRRAMRYPPIVALVNVIVRGSSMGEAMSDAAGLAAATEPPAGGFQVLGPAPAPLGRLRGEYRAQFFLKGTSRASMRERLVAALAARPALRRRVTVDVDPLSVL